MNGKVKMFLLTLVLFVFGSPVIKHLLFDEKKWYSIRIKESYE